MTPDETERRTIGKLGWERGHNSFKKNPMDSYHDTLSYMGILEKHKISATKYVRDATDSSTPAGSFDAWMIIALQEEMYGKEDSFLAQMTEGASLVSRMRRHAIQNEIMTYKRSGGKVAHTVDGHVAITQGFFDLMEKTVPYVTELVQTALADESKDKNVFMMDDRSIWASLAGQDRSGKESEARSDNDIDVKMALTNTVGLLINNALQGLGLTVDEFDRIDIEIVDSILKAAAWKVKARMMLDRVGFNSDGQHNLRMVSDKAMAPMDSKTSREILMESAAEALSKHGVIFWNNEIEVKADGKGRHFTLDMENEFEKEIAAFIADGSITGKGMEEIMAEYHPEWSAMVPVIQPIAGADTDKYPVEASGYSVQALSEKFGVDIDTRTHGGWMLKRRVEQGGAESYGNESFLMIRDEDGGLTPLVYRPTAYIAAKEISIYSKDAMLAERERRLELERERYERIGVGHYSMRF